MTSVELDGSALKSSVAFTGRLACMSRAEAFEVVRQRGGTPSPAVTKRTQVLIVGELGWPLLDDGRPSNKLSRATALGIPIVSERRFLEWVGKAVPDNVQKTYSADQLAALSKMSSGMIRELAQLEPVGRAGWPFRLSRPGQRPSDRQAAQRRGSPVGNHPRRQRNPEMASRRRIGRCPASCRRPQRRSGRASLAAERTNTVSSSLQLMALATIPMNCSIGRILLSRSGTLPKPRGSIAFL